MVILDLGLPDMDGTEVIQRVRGWTATPIIVLSVWGAGAARRSRRSTPAPTTTSPSRSAWMSCSPGCARRSAGPSPAPDEPVVQHRPTSPSTWPPSGSISSDGADVRLTPTEWQLLEILVRNRGRLVTQRQLLQDVWGPAYEIESPTTCASISPSSAASWSRSHPARRYLLTEPGMGYRFQV